MRQSFERTGNGRACDPPAGSGGRQSAGATVAVREWRTLAQRLALVAVGGFGRKELFPSSDVDLLYLCADTKTEEALRETIRGCNQAMWDLGLRASPMIRTLKEC